MPQLTDPDYKARPRLRESDLRRHLLAQAKVDDRVLEDDTTPDPRFAATPDALKKAGVPVLAYGNFLTVAVNFMILAFVIFLMVQQINRLKRELPHAEKAPPAPPEQIVLLREIRDSLRRP